MGVLKFFKNILGLKETITIDLAELPSRGLFYKDDMVITMSKCSVNDIAIYEKVYNPEDLMVTLNLMRYIIMKCLKFNKKYSYRDLKSTDVVFLFFKIVKYTLDKKINIPYFDNEISEVNSVEFCPETFNYFDFEPYMDNYDYETKEILLDGYKLSLPTIGAEESLIKYITHKGEEISSDELISYSYDFMYFLGNRNKLSIKEIENLIIIFNSDMRDKDKAIVRNIVNQFNTMVIYSVIKNSEIIPIKHKIDLANIWK